MRVSSRYVLLPNGKRIDIGLDQAPAARETRQSGRRNSARRSRKNYSGR
jgi:hypothetical protein